MKRLFLLVMALLAASVLAFTSQGAQAVSGPGTSAGPPGFLNSYTPFEHSDTSGNLSGYCLDDPNNSTVNGTKLQLYSCNGLPQQQWRAVSIGPGQWEYQTVNGKCLDLTNDNHANGTPMQIWTCLGDDSQNFAVFDITPNGVAGVWINYNHNLGGWSLDDTNDRNANGNKVQIWQNLRDNSQYWSCRCG